MQRSAVSPRNLLWPLLQLRPQIIYFHPYTLDPTAQRAHSGANAQHTARQFGYNTTCKLLFQLREVICKTQLDLESTEMLQPHTSLTLRLCVAKIYCSPWPACAVFHLQTYFICASSANKMYVPSPKLPQWLLVLLHTHPS